MTNNSSLPTQVVFKVLELIQRDDVRSVSCPYDDSELWRALVDEQVRRSKQLSLLPQKAFTLCGPDGGLSNVPIEEWGGRVHIPYEGMCGGDLVIYPTWRNFFAENAEKTGRLSTAVRFCCYYILSPKDFGDLSCASRTSVGDWVLYRSNAPYVPCAPLDE